MVTSLSALTEMVPIDDFAVIGGLAVLARLEGAHRVTDDLDTVATQRGDAMSGVEAVLVPPGPNGFLIGTKVDCSSVGDVAAADLAFSSLPEDDQDRVFVLCHRWALDTAEVVTVSAEQAGAVVVRVRCRFAIPGSLVAMKLQSAPRRKGATIHKAGGDYLDIFRLASHPSLTDSIASSLRMAPHDLTSWCRQEIQRSMIDEAMRTVGVIVRSGVGELGVPTAVQLQRTGLALIERIDRKR